MAEAMAQPLQTTQSPLLTGAYKTLQKLGGTFSRLQTTNPTPNPRQKNIDLGQFKNLGQVGQVGQKIGSLGTLTVPYGGSTSFEKFHPGIDIGNVKGTSIPAFAGGTVSQVVSGKKHGDSGFGNYVIITDSQGNQHRYSHLQNEFVKVGQQVPAGYNIGTIGATGQTYSASGQGEGPHLDYRIKNAYGKYVNPFTFINNLTGKNS